MEHAPHFSSATRVCFPPGSSASRESFASGDTVSVLDREGDEIARGVTNYSCADLERIRGSRSSEIPQVLGRASGMRSSTKTTL